MADMLIDARYMRDTRVMRADARAKERRQRCLKPTQKAAEQTRKRAGEANSPPPGTVASIHVWSQNYLH